MTPRTAAPDGGEMASCLTCQQWKEPGYSNDDSVGPSTYRYPTTEGAAQASWRIEGQDESLAFKSPPHANLMWGRCDAAPCGWGSDADRSAVKMAVWDGSEYYATLLTRCDHVCGEWRTAALNRAGER